VVVRGLYLADCEETAWAEWLRATAERGVPPSEALPRTVFGLDVDLEDIADLTSPAARALLRIPRLQPTRRQWPLTQPVGERLWRGGARGILAPSAAHVGHRVLAVFRTGPVVDGVVELTPGTNHDTIPIIPTGLRT
jgi:RES domain-containing protein